MMRRRCMIGPDRASAVSDGVASVSLFALVVLVALFLALPVTSARAEELPAEEQAEVQDQVSDSPEALADAEVVDDESPANDEANPTEAEEEVVPADPDAVQLREAQSAVLLDQSGTVLYELNPEQELPLASITKVMTAMLALDSQRPLDEEVELVEPDLGPYSQMADFGQGDRITFGELLRVMLVYSANDAAYNVAVLTSGSEEAFVELMNARATELGMTHTHFVNPHGLEDDHHYSCAMDVARMGLYAMQNYPFIAQCVSLHQVTVPVRGEQVTFTSTDKLLGAFEGMRGVKTGAVSGNTTFLGASGRGKVQLYSAVLGCQTNEGRFDDTASLMEWGYAHYQDMELSHPDWVVRVHPFAFDMGMRSVVSTAQSCVGKVWPSGDGVSYQSVLSKPHRLLDSDTPYGWTAWTQGQRSLGSSFFITRPTPVRVSSWPTFSLPLFENMRTLGRELV